MALSSESDTELVSRVAGGDAGALEELYDRYSQPVFSMAYSILKEYTAAEDVTQDVFIALWSRAARFDPARGVFRHWFLHLAHNRVIDEVRRRRRTAVLSAGKAPDDAELGLVSSGNTAEEAIDAVLIGAARDALMSLPEEQRTVLVMAYLEGATQREIAQRTGAPLGTVKTRARLGLIKLRELMAQPAGEEAG